MGKTPWRGTVVTVQTQLLFFQMKHSISSVSMLFKVKSIWPMSCSAFILPDLNFVFGVWVGKLIMTTICLKQEDINSIYTSTRRIMKDSWSQMSSRLWYAWNTFGRL